jgi:F0F1-type ATP synthase assembly protein I
MSEPDETHDKVQAPPVVGSVPVSEIAGRFAVVCASVLVQLSVLTMAGYWLDNQLGFLLFMPIGVCLGMVLAAISLIRFAGKWTPQARRSKNELKDDEWTKD